MCPCNSTESWRSCSFRGPGLGGWPWGSVKEKDGSDQPYLVTPGQGAGLAVRYKKEAYGKGRRLSHRGEN